jgi:hypothetical protein
MKLSKTSWWILTVGIFVIFFAGLGLVRFQQIQQRNQLLREITVAEVRLNGFQPDQLSAQKAELERQLDQTTSQFEAVKAIFSQPVKSVAASSILFDIAEAHELEVTEISSLGLDNDSLYGINCSVISLTARVEGDVTNLVSFIIDLNSQLVTDTIRSIAITFPEIDSGEKASADINMIIYTYQGD